MIRIRKTAIKMSWLISLTLMTSLALAAAPDCEPVVDLADSLDFERMHGDCNDKTVIHKNSKPQAAENTGAGFTVREPFTLTGGPHSAINGLFVQMADHCPKGWQKLSEWTEPANTGYFLHYQFKCRE